MSNNIEDILENLSYSMSSPEAEDFHDKLIHKDLDGAREILKDHLHGDYIELVINYFLNINSINFNICEMNIKDIPDHEDHQYYLIRVGTGLFQAKLFKSAWEDTGLVFLTSQRTFMPKVVNQIWKIIK